MITRLNWKFLSAAPGLVFLLFAHAIGCGGAPARQPPKTYPVQGKVQYKDGKPVTKGLIEFRAETEPVVANGMIASDGSFVLKTAFANGHLEGAVAGQHKVTFHPFMEQAQEKGPIQHPVTLPNPIVVEAQDKNSINIQIDRFQNE